MNWITLCVFVRAALKPAAFLIGLMLFSSVISGAVFDNFSKWGKRLLWASVVIVICSTLFAAATFPELCIEAAAVREKYSAVFK